MIRAHMRGVTEGDCGLLPLRQSSDPRIILLQPLLHQRLVPFQRAMQRLLAGDAELRQQPSDRDHAQWDVEFLLDQCRHHLARPQCKCEFELQRALLRHRVINPAQLLATEFWWPSEQRLCFQRTPATTPILRQPAIHRRSIDTQNTCNNFRAFAVLNAAHRTLTHRLQRRVIQSSSIVLPHHQRESYSSRHVKKSLITYVLINRGHRTLPPSRSLPRPCRNPMVLAMKKSLASLDRKPSCPANEIVRRPPPRTQVVS